MAFTAKEVMQRAQFILQDAGAVRWTAPELRLWLNDALREIAIQKPNATAETVEITLQEGAWQRLPTQYQALIRITRNLDTLDGDLTKRGGGRAITPIVREVLDMQIPGWMDTAVMPYAATAMHYVDDITDMHAFYVVPGNDGTGVVEAIVSTIPDEVPAPGANVLDIDSYTTEVDISDIYRNAVIDYMLYRAFSKDTNVVGGPQRAQAHYQQFATAIGMKFQAEQATMQAARTPQ